MHARQSQVGLANFVLEHSPSLTPFDHLHLASVKGMFSELSIIYLACLNVHRGTFDCCFLGKDTHPPSNCFQVVRCDSHHGLGDQCYFAIHSTYVCFCAATLLTFCSIDPDAKQCQVSSLPNMLVMTCHRHDQCDVIFCHLAGATISLLTRDGEKPVKGQSLLFKRICLAPHRESTCNKVMQISRMYTAQLITRLLNAHCTSLQL